MLRSLSKAIKACQGFKEGNWRWLKWKVRMWGQCWNSLNGRPVSGWSIMDSVLKALGLIHLNIREDWIHQRTSQCNSKSSLCIWKPEAVCEFPAVLRFLRNLRKSGGELDSARALIVPSSLSPAFYFNYNHLMMTVIIIRGHAHIT